jgi:tRNA(adenine34) deaminase
MHDVTAHAEILAIKKASEKIKSWRLNNCSIIVTLEPCPMCLSAILQARIANLYFGAYDKKGGALSLGYTFHKDFRLNHRFNVYGGFRHLECAKILTDYFKTKRRNYNT